MGDLPRVVPPITRGQTVMIRARMAGMQAQDGNDGDEEADAEHEGEEGLFALVELQLGDDW